MQTLILLLKCLLLHVASTTTISVTHNGTSCPCMSYHNLPDYQCLLTQLRSNRTIPPVCIQLIQGLDSAHFTIYESLNFQCPDHHQIYMYKAHENPKLIGKNRCQSTFGQLVSFHILTSRKEFYEVVSRNLEILGLEKISCQLSSIPKRVNVERCERFDNLRYGRYFDYKTLFNITFMYENGTMEIADFHFNDNKFIVGFLKNLNSTHLSPGKIVINNTQKPTDYYKLGHMIIFNCSWGGDSTYTGYTMACLETNWKRGQALELHLNHQRIIDNSCITFGLSWNIAVVPGQWLKGWNMLCKFFDVRDSFLQDAMCGSCWNSQVNCSECWDSVIFGDISSILNLTGLKLNCLFWQDCALVLRLRTNFQNITFGNGSFFKVLSNTDLNADGFYRAFDIFQYDYFFGRYSRYWNSEDAQNDYLSWLSNSVVLPGPQKMPTPLTDAQINSLGAMCKVRAAYTDNSFSHWSNTINKTFNKFQSFSSHVAVVVFQYGGDDFSDFIGATAWSDRISVHRTSEPLYKSFFSCEYRVILLSSLMPSKDPASNSYTFRYREAGKKWESTNLQAKSEPLVVKCAALHPFMLWTEQLEQSDGFNVFQAKLNELTGKPLSNGVSKLSPLLLCKCSSQKSITSPSIQITYRSMSNPETVGIAVACGKVICETDYRNENFAKVQVPWMPEYGNITSFVLDQNFTYFVTSDAQSIVKVFAKDQNTVALHSTRGHKIRQIIPWSEKIVEDLPAPYKHCIDPYIDSEQSSVVMSRNGTLKITAFLAWNTSQKCAQFSKPPVIIITKYAVLPKGLNFREGAITARNFKISCKSPTSLECKSLPATTVYGVTQFTSNISEIVHDRLYLIEIRVKAYTYHDLWYHGQLHDPRQVYRKVVFTKSQQQSVYIWAIPSAIGTLLVVIIITGTFYWLYTRKMDLYKYLQRLSANDIQRIDKLGEGNFGEVWKAKIGKDTVVIKMLKESATDREEKEFREEALLLSKFSSEYIVHAIGICLQSRPIMLGLEYINGGSLNSYLKRNEVRSALDAADLLRIAADALNGCIYLEQEGYIHRDIASRNCLVEMMSDTNVKPKYVKLSDFGLAKDIGAESIYGSRDPDADILPIAWTAPEAFSGKFSPKSDVWAFGVLVWEIFSWAATPYGTCSSFSEWHICPMHSLGHDEIEFRVCAEKKNLLDFSDPCTAFFCAALKSVLAVCWKFEADDRPSFKQLQKYLNGAKADISKIDVQMQEAFARQMSSTSSSSAGTGLKVSGGQRRNLMSSAYDTGTAKSDDVENPFNAELFSDGNREETVELLTL